jgi:hypothetical protein
VSFSFHPILPSHHPRYNNNNACCTYKSYIHTHS